MAATGLFMGETDSMYVEGGERKKCCPRSQVLSCERTTFLPSFHTDIFKCVYVRFLDVGPSA